MNKPLTPTELATELSISPSTLRKYSLLLEENGFVFQRNAKNSRQYAEADVMALQEMITLIKSNGMTVENASYAVSTKYGTETRTAESDDAGNALERQNGDVSAVMIGEIRELKETIQGQQETIDGFRIAQEKRDKLFVEILEDLQGEISSLKEQAKLPAPDPSPDPQLLLEVEGLREEIKQLKEAAAAKEEEPEEKKGFFARLFK